jgi:methylase of polypeptide subunit release factors
MTRQRNKKRIEYGDFQTPANFADQVCKHLRSIGVKAHSILEPTCGQGSLLLAALDTFDETVKVVGIEVNSEHVNLLHRQLAHHLRRQLVNIIIGDFFAMNWTEILNKLPEPILVIGNPPWVTNAELAILNSENVPHKTNFQNHTGLAARTGKSNFDISEWMLIHLVEQLKERRATVAMLCKTSVARKVLTYAWKNQLPIADARIHRIDANQHFAAAVDACLFICSTGGTNRKKRCQLFDQLNTHSYLSSFGFEDGRLIADLSLYSRWRHLLGSTFYRWRSGIKHDCASIMEFRRTGDSEQYINGLGETWTLEPTFIYPMLKSSDLMHPLRAEPRYWMLVPQQKLGDDPVSMQAIAPDTWKYLQSHGEYLDKRKSTIYQHQPRFSIFGVGPYSFSHWKVAISGLYKRLNFITVGPHDGRPVVFDDTCYFLSCNCQEEAELLTTTLNSEIAQQFFQGLIFWDTKRPITSEILNQLDIFALANELGCSDRLSQLNTKNFDQPDRPQQLTLLC